MRSFSGFFRPLWIRVNNGIKLGYHEIGLLQADFLLYYMQILPILA